jgi:methionyl-tRNA synthetase
MSVSGLCQICQSAEAEDQCASCGALVCRMHLDRSTGYCAECVSEGQRDTGTYQF